MRNYQKKHMYYCGIDLHTKSLSVCIPDRKGKSLNPHYSMRFSYGLSNMLCAYLIATTQFITDDPNFLDIISTPLEKPAFIKSSLTSVLEYK